MEPKLDIYDKEQVKFMKEDQCILVDENDQPRGSASKLECHRWSAIEEGSALHRAFSVFLFDEAGKQLLLQQRAADKITFPLMWTNTCCSHPLNVDEERNGVQGVQKAAVRKLEHELGIQKGDVPEESLLFLTRLLYRAREADTTPWGEHEVDYVLIARKKVDTHPNAGEVVNVRWVDRNQLKEMLAGTEESITPWFRLICTHFLLEWWESHIEGGASLETIAQPEKIWKMYK